MASLLGRRPATQLGADHSLVWKSAKHSLEEGWTEDMPPFVNVPFQTRRSQPLFPDEALSDISEEEADDPEAGTLKDLAAELNFGHMPSQTLPVLIEGEVEPISDPTPNAELYRPEVEPKQCFNPANAGDY